MKNQIFIGNLPHQLTHEDLKPYFSLLVKLFKYSSLKIAKLNVHGVLVLLLLKRK